MRDFSNDPNSTFTNDSSFDNHFDLNSTPTSVHNEDKYLQIFNNFYRKQNELEGKINSYSKEINSYQKEMQNITNKNIEVIGLFSSILALLIINVNIITKVELLLDALILIVALTSCLAVFAYLLHWFFGNDSSLKKSIWIPISVLCLILIITSIFNLSNQYSFKVEKKQNNTTESATK